MYTRISGLGAVEKKKIDEKFAECSWARREHCEDIAVHGGGHARMLHVRARQKMEIGLVMMIVVVVIKVVIK